jgi:hypothetical protein
MRGLRWARRRRGEAPAARLCWWRARRQAGWLARTGELRAPPRRAHAADILFCFGDSRTVSLSPSLVAAHAMAEASASKSATRVGMAFDFGRGEDGSEGAAAADLQSGLSRRRQELQPRAQQWPWEGGCCTRADAPGKRSPCLR